MNSKQDVWSPMINYFLFIWSLLYFFHYHLVSLYPCPPAIPTLLSMSVSPFSFLLNPSTRLPPSPTICHLLSIYESVPIFLVSSVCSLDSTYEWIIWYLSFSDWLISLSIMFSRTIHTVAKGKIFFLWLSSILLCKCSIVVLSTHLLMDTWAASTSWRL